MRPFPSTIATAIASLVFAAGPAGAQPTVTDVPGKSVDSGTCDNHNSPCPPLTFVSGKGVDGGNCDDKSSPCRTFQYAVDHTGLIGEVQALDAADYGPVTISLPISITGVDGAGIFVDMGPGGGAAITIDTGPFNDRVNLSGLTIVGRWETSNPMPTGILVKGSGKFTMTHCTVQNFLGVGNRH